VLAPTVAFSLYVLIHICVSEGFVRDGGVCGRGNRYKRVSGASQATQPSGNSVGPLLHPYLAMHPSAGDVQVDRVIKDY
jgi:hypothetical protein